MNFYFLLYLTEFSKKSFTLFWGCCLSFWKEKGEKTNCQWVIAQNVQQQNTAVPDVTTLYLSSISINKISPKFLFECYSKVLFRSSVTMVTKIIKTTIVNFNLVLIFLLIIVTLLAQTFHWLHKKLCVWEKHVATEKKINILFNPCSYSFFARY